jgi:hypothetical protein
MGRALHRRQSYKTRVVSTIIPLWPGGPKLLEYRALMVFPPVDNLYPKLSAAVRHLLSIKSWFSLQTTTFPLATLQELGGYGHEYYQYANYVKSSNILGGYATSTFWHDYFTTAPWVTMQWAFANNLTTSCTSLYSSLELTAQVVTI